MCMCVSAYLYTCMCVRALDFTAIRGNSPPSSNHTSHTPPPPSKNTHTRATHTPLRWVHRQDPAMYLRGLAAAGCGRAAATGFSGVQVRRGGEREVGREPGW